MRFLNLLCNRHLLVFGALAMTLAPHCLMAQNEGFCTQATLKGAYVMSATGTRYAGTPPQPVGTGGTVAKVVYDGQGGATSTQTLSAAGTIFRQITATGSYTVNSDCTGSKTFTSSTGQVSHFDFVVTPNGQTITFIETDPGFVLTGTAVRMDSRSE